MGRSIDAGHAPAASDSVRIVEHELDMIRRWTPPRVTVGRLERIVAWLMPGGRSVGPPMRSIARELEELMPARDN
ncbi:MAG TPA: hypothetical protein VMA09_20060 [Candidatus Binataceae bacterium]|nr:hypothetical protein [Candidatus Binataceae bacterium]